MYSNASLLSYLNDKFVPKGLKHASEKGIRTLPPETS